MEEIWKDIPDFERYYQVSNIGNVRSLDRDIDKGNVIQPRKGKMKTLRLNSDGYVIVKLCKDGKGRYYPVHRLVASAFIDKRDYKDGWEINHKDAIRTNNNYENLEWVTHRENIDYAVRLGHYIPRFGADNYNYGNHTLKKKYQEHPELLKLQSRPGKQNGRCVPVILENIETHEVLEFDYLREAAKYIFNNNLNKDTRIKKLDTCATKLKKYMNTPKSFLGFLVKSRA